MHWQASHQQFTIEARSILRRALAETAGAKVSGVAIEGVQRAKAGISVALTVATGADVLAAQRLVRQLQVQHAAHALILCFSAGHIARFRSALNRHIKTVSIEICYSVVLHSQEDAREAAGGSQLEELMGPIDASCTEAAIQGGTAPGQDVTHVAEHAGPSNEEKSIVPVSASQLTPVP